MKFNTAFALLVTTMTIDGATAASVSVLDAVDPPQTRKTRSLTSKNANSCGTENAMINVLKEELETLKSSQNFGGNGLGSISGDIVTHYWDCKEMRCSASSGAPDPGNDDFPKTLTCEGDGQNIHRSCFGSDKNPKGSAACSSFVPIIEGSTLYGLAAISADKFSNYAWTRQCGKCYSMNVNNSVNNLVKKAVVMVTNTGDLRDAAFDFLVPGGGFGEFPDACNQMKGWNVKAAGCINKDTDTCDRYGGLHEKSQCGVAFPEDKKARKACEDVLFGVFPSQQYQSPKYRANLEISNIQSVNCPSLLTQKAPSFKCPANCGAICGSPYYKCFCDDLQTWIPNRGSNR